MPNNIKVTSGGLSNSNTKKVNDKTLIRATTADGKVRWIDPKDYRDFNGKIGYAYYNDKGERAIENGLNQFTQWLEGKPKSTLEQVNKIAAAMGYTQQDLDNAANTERMENSVYAKDKPLESVYPEFYLLTGARGLANGAFTPIWNAIKPGGYMWANPITKQVLASEAAARGMDATSIGLTGKTIADNLYSGNNPYLRFAAESANPGYWMPYSGFKPAWEALNEYGNKALTFYNSPLTGKWTRFGNKEYRLNPGTIGMNGGAVERRVIQNSPRTTITAEDLANRKYVSPTTSKISVTTSEPLMEKIKGFEGIEVPEGFTPIKAQSLNTRNGIRTIHLVKDKNGKTKILEDMQFKSELDWSPKSWYEEAGGRKYKDGRSNQYTDKDIKDLEANIPEYIEIERKAKQDGTWLKMPDGSTWTGDPRSWVQLQSKAVQKHNPEAFYTGIRKEIDPNYNEILWGLPVSGLEKLAQAVARTYAHDDAHVLPMITKKYEDPRLTTTINAGKAKDWRFIRDSKTGKQQSTDDIVKQYSTKKVVKINKVMDRGDITKPKEIPHNSKYYHEGIAENEDLFQNNIILNPGTWRKALIGGNGNFKHPTHMYRVIIPTMLTTGLGYSLFNKNHN